MQIGIGLPTMLPGASAELIRAWTRQAEEGPFSSLGVFDRPVYDGYDPLIALAGAAALTQRLRLATTIVLAPLRNTVLFAKEVATLAAFAGGRLVLGLAAGIREDDYRAAGVDYHTRGQRFSAQLEELRNLWEAEILGPPGSLTLLIGGQSPQAFARMARHAHGYVHGGGPPRAFARAAAQARAAWSDSGRPGRPLLWAHAYFALGDEATLDRGRRTLEDYYAFSGPFARRVVAELLTDPQAIARFLRGYAEAGCDELILFPTVADLRQLERLRTALETL
jgi:alkanesulfonate monooxygenase SsuD/methylene tetrahydromethanopterin reductase-like flavin-dependent oxidoreductase (luciferase family)